MDTTPPPIPPIKSSSLAIWSLVLAILGMVSLLMCIGPLFAIPAVICGHLAQSRIRRSGGALDGRGLALTGLITGYVCIGLSILLIPMMAAIAIPNFVKARATAQKNTCINNLRIIDGAKQQWALENSKTADAIPTEKDLGPYLPKGMTFDTLKCPASGVYSLNKIGAPPTCSIPTHAIPQFDQ
jgi:hypothetical protein